MGCNFERSGVYFSGRGIFFWGWERVYVHMQRVLVRGDGAWVCLCVFLLSFLGVYPLGARARARVGGILLGPPFVSDGACRGQ